MSIISFSNVYKKYDDPDVIVLKDFNLEVEKGEFIVITGASGSGKTTLLSMLLKETEPSYGNIVVNGVNLKEITDKKIPYYRRNLGVVFQDYKLIQNLSAYDNVKIAHTATGGRKKDAFRKVSSWFVLLGIDKLSKRFPCELSGGECQKICLARALVNSPQILLADEPTGNLDPNASDEIFNLFRIIHNQGITVVLATHDVERARSLEFAREINLDRLKESY